MVNCFIALGSNLGDRKYYIDTAIRKIRTLANTRVIKVSRLIETLPQGGPAQGPYLNAVLEAATELSPYQLLFELQRIEAALGRVRVVLNGPRTIDLDILTYGDCRINEQALCIPHPRMLERDFVLIPLKEIAGGVVKKLFSKKKNVVSRKVVKNKSLKSKRTKRNKRG
ncbi:MAG: 2-amino-4-hydroxy-6-hydroxymethyldihydropteridine diphosphokinase [Candidatus Omnitrophica bacterium]|nr:2-amino-4-hydroxy-6-hydroxymethyldihydropteridine diphosphokinase [Candidatus Omnitrophota bacterium]